MRFRGIMTVHTGLLKKQSPRNRELFVFLLKDYSNEVVISIDLNYFL